jgi:transcriptional regulator
MYIPNSLAMQPTNQVNQFIKNYGFGVLVSEPLQANHLPFLFQPEVGESGVLYSHMARANPHWQKLNGEPVLIIFNGPHSYISATWYASGPAVPTWNYAAVHVYGKFELLNDEQTVQVVKDTVKQYEPELLNNDDLMPEDYQQKLSKAIVSFKVTVTNIEAKHKLGQQRKQEDQQGVISALEKSDNTDAVGLAQYMRKTNVGIG